MKKLNEKELKQEFESLRGGYRLALMSVILGGIGVAAFLTLFFDPFGWLAGTPAVHDAKKWIALCVFFVLVPGLACIWFLIMLPLRTGVVPVGGWANAVSISCPRLVLRSENPVRFRVAVIWNCALVAATLAFGLFGLAKFIRDLEKAKEAGPNHSMQRRGASRSDQLQLAHQLRLAPTADADRWRKLI